MEAFYALSLYGQLRRLHKLASKALDAYDLVKPRLFLQGFSDTITFRVDTADKQRFLLRIHRPTNKTEAMVRSEMLWLQALQQEPDMAVPCPIPTRNGDLLTVTSINEVPEPRMSVLLRWMSGRFLDSKLTPEYLEKVGIFIARLQNSGARFQAPEGFVRGRLDHLCGNPPGLSEAQARQQIDNPHDEEQAIRMISDFYSPGDGRRVETLIHHIRGIQRLIGQGPETFGLIHGDLHQEHYFFERSQVRAIDFDDCGYGYYVYDLAVTLLSLGNRWGSAEMRASLLAGYRSVRPLSVEHEQYLNTFIDLRELQMLIWMIEMRDNPAFVNIWEKKALNSLNHIQKAVEQL
jgi:Ser/Thr protein kinase RdoA (MazF antagonist)